MASLVMSSCSSVNYVVSSVNRVVVDPIVSLVESKRHPEVRSDAQYWDEMGRGMEVGILKAVDKKRKAAGFKPVIIDKRIADVARKHSQSMVKQYVKTGKVKIGHKGFRKRFTKLALDFNYSKVGENVGFLSYRDDFALKMTQMWLNSSGHRKNMLSKWTASGVGVAIAPDGTVFVTQLFGLKTNNIFD